MSFMSSSRNEDSRSAHIPPQLSDLHCFTETEGVITTTMFDIPGYKVVKVLGTVYGLTVRSRNVVATVGMEIKSLAGGELRWFTNMLYTARNDAISRAVTETKQRGGNAIICLRFESGDFGAGQYAQCSAYGTAAIVEKADPTIEAPAQLVN
ncbi:putative heavy-metal-binding-domain-containing protein [Whalleya microplaca]|nr:putative heavy-metal-binding-domain-containing protein [Whalleya microplaca]